MPDQYPVYENGQIRFRKMHPLCWSLERIGGRRTAGIIILHSEMNELHVALAKVRPDNTPYEVNANLTIACLPDGYYLQCKVSVREVYLGSTSDLAWLRERVAEHPYKPTMPQFIGTLRINPAS